MKKAIIIGHTGQDGGYLNQLLKIKGYDTVGISGKSVLASNGNFGDLISIADAKAVENLIVQFQPDEVYYLAAIHQSSVDSKIEDGELFLNSMNINVAGVVNFLESIRKHSIKTKLFYAASSHIFGNTLSMQQDETTVINPDCIYGITKSAGLRACRFYREKNNIFASVGIFYNHESPARESKYVSKKIVETAVAIRNKLKNELILGDIDSRIDWGYAPDYVEAAFRIVQLPNPDDFIISSGFTHSIADFVETAFTYLGLEWKKYIKIDTMLINKKQKQNLFGNNCKIKIATGWQPSVSFDQMVKILVDEELKKYASQ